jgi:putative ATPase
LLNLEKATIDHISSISSGDSRVSLNILELLDSYFKTPPPNTKISVEQIKPILSKLPTLYDRSGDFHYDSISALHKSIRGSNVNASLWYLSVMLKNGEDPLYIARRLIRIASEDIGIVDDSCLPFAVATYQAVQFVGLPEADLALVHCVAKLATAKKSVKIYRAWKEIKNLMNGELNEKFGVSNGMDIPIQLRNAPTGLMKDLGYGEGYKYNPNYKDGKVKQRYFTSDVLENYDFVGKSEHLGDLTDPDL